MNKRMNTLTIWTRFKKMEKNVVQPYNKGNKYYMFEVHEEEADY
jgi:hypothetical protein